MSFAWPGMLLLLLGLPLLVVRYRQLAARRAARRAELAALGLVAPASVSAASRRRRVVPPLLFLAAVGLLLVGLARPEATLSTPHREGTVVLAFDVSNSMAATDLKPTRLDVAKAAARTLVTDEPASIKIAVVAFGESGIVAQQPTLDRDLVRAAIDRLSPQGGTTIGRGIQASLAAITGRKVEIGATPGSDTQAGPDIGYFGSAAVLLLTDGENTGGGPNTDAATAVASTAGVKVYPVGLGTPEGAVLQIDGFQVATALDEAALRNIAEVTDGRYFSAADQKQLSSIYRAVDLAWTIETRPMEITALLAGMAGLLMLVGAGLSFAWFGRVI